MNELRKVAREAAESAVQRLLTTTSPQPEYLRTRDAARYLGLSPEWLELARTQGNGPAFVKLPRAVLYKRSDLDRFMASHRVCSTSEVSERKARR